MGKTSEVLKSVANVVRGAVEFVKAFRGSPEQKQRGGGPQRRRTRREPEPSAPSAQAEEVETVDEPVEAKDVEVEEPADAKQEEATEAEDEVADEQEGEAVETELTDIWGVAEARVDLLREMGYETVQDVADASADDLTEISGVGESTAQKIIDSAKELVG